MGELHQTMELQQAMLELLERCFSGHPELITILHGETGVSLHSVIRLLEELARQTDQIALDAAIDISRAEEQNPELLMVTRESGVLAWKIHQYVDELRAQSDKQPASRDVSSRPEEVQQAQVILQQLNEISLQMQNQLEGLQKACNRMGVSAP